MIAFLRYYLSIDDMLGTRPGSVGDTGQGFSSLSSFAAVFRLRYFGPVRPISVPISPTASMVAR